MDLDTTHPALSDLARTARRRIPHFVWEYLDSATGTEATLRRNAEALDRVLLMPAILRGERHPDISTTLMGRDYALPFGIAPVGMSGLIWPDAERRLARLAAKHGMPYGLSNVASQMPETVGPHAGDQGWFQLYPPGDGEIRRDLLARARDSGFHTLIMTADVPVASRRERQRRGRLSNPPKLTPYILAQIATKPAWAMGTWQTGMPRLRTLDKYSGDVGKGSSKGLPSTAHVGYLLRTSPDWSYVRAVRKEWKGKLVVKGVMDPRDARPLLDEGVDAIWVSNHAGRQFDASPASIEALPKVREAAPEAEIIFDSGIRGGLDILRAIALGADFVMLGRAWHYGLGAFGDRGAEYVVKLLREDIESNMGQLGCDKLMDVRDRLIS